MPASLLTRRELLQRLALAGLATPLYPQLVPNPEAPVPQAALLASSPASFSSAGDALLDEIERAACLYFWEQAGARTGLVKDRALAAGNDARTLSSIAATGFGLSALAIAASRGWRSEEAARRRARDTLRFLWEKMPHERGFFYHFVDMNTGARQWRSEVSSIDSSILLCGVMTAAEHFHDAELSHLAQAIYERTDWPWFLDGALTLSMGWKPESGFLKARWDTYSELMMIYLLGLGSPTHPLPAACWDVWKRPIFHYYGLSYIGARAPLFVNQYSHAWFDFRGQRDRYANYFQNSILATEAHKRFCLGLRKKFPDYSDRLWGITASDSSRGYVGWGGPPAMGPLDGTVVPAAAGGSLPFLPQDCALVLETMRRQYGAHAWRRYGLVDAFNPLKGWYDADVLGIDLGITALMAENARTGFLWNTFMKHPAAKRGMARAGFHPEARGQVTGDRGQHAER